MELIKHETFNIYGDKKEIEALQDSIIAENEAFLKFMSENKDFKKSFNDYEYVNCGKYNGKVVQLIVTHKLNQVDILWGGVNIGYCYNSKSNNAWVVNIFEEYESDDGWKVTTYTGKKGLKGRDVLVYAITNDFRTMYETYADAFQYYQTQEEEEEPSYEYEGDGYEFYMGINNGECSNCRGGGCWHCEPNRFL